MLFILFLISTLLLVFLVLIFCNINKIQKRKKLSDNQKVHFKLSIFKYFYAEFDYEINNDEGKTKK